MLVVLLLISASVLVGLAVGASDDAGNVFDVAIAAETAPEDEPEPDEADPPPTTEPGPPSDEDLDETVAEISAFVEEERGLEFVDPVDVELVGDDEFEDRLLEDFDAAADQLAQEEVLLKGFGLVDAEDSLAEEMEEMMGAGVVGFYHPVTKELVIRATELTPFARKVIAHELTHALDDQQMDLDRPEYDEADDEIAFGFSALVEGNARTIEERYFDTELTDDEQSDSIDEELSIGTDVGFPDFSLALLEMSYAPYAYGPDLIEALLDEGGTERLDEAFADPPRTSEQVLDPDVYLAAEPAIDVIAPVADGEVVVDHVLGQLFIELTLGDQIDRDTAADAAEGWGGDWATSWSDGSRSCIRAVMVGDTAEDSDELFAAWSEWSQEVDLDAVVEQPGAGQPMTLTSCTR